MGPKCCHCQPSLTLTDDFPGGGGDIRRGGQGPPRPHRLQHQLLRRHLVPEADGGLSRHLHARLQVLDGGDERAAVQGEQSTDHKVRFSGSISDSFGHSQIWF